MDKDFDIDTFLQRPLFAHLATTCDEGARESPVWYLWEDGSMWLVGNDRDTFPRRLRRDPRCAVGVVDFDLQRGLLQHVGVRGITTVDALDRSRLGRLLRRYLGDDEAMWNSRFRESIIDRLSLMIRIDPTSIVARDQSYFASAFRELS